MAKIDKGRARQGGPAAHHEHHGHGGGHSHQGVRKVRLGQHEAQRRALHTCGMKRSSGIGGGVARPLKMHKQQQLRALLELENEGGFCSSDSLQMLSAKSERRPSVLLL